MSLSSILVPVSGTPTDKHLVELACQLLHSSSSRLFILYIMEIKRSLPIDAALPGDVIHGDNVLKSMEKIADNFKHETKGELLQARETGYAIVHEAAKKHVDGIVMSVPNTIKYGKFHLEKTVPYVLENAHCKVILWHAEKVKQHS